MNVHTFEPRTTPSGPGPPMASLLNRVRGEFLEMPAMHITLDQAMRLWSMDRDTCTTVLGYLTAARFLDRDPQGKFVLAHGGY